MQDIVFYAAANETLGVVRDYANARNQPAPVLTLGVSVCLRIRLFAEPEGATPYPVSSFNGIAEWKWRMDGDFDRSTVCKLVADDGGISVHSVTDTVNGETRGFTEFVIPISDMNTQELTDWLGPEKQRSGLIGELVGYDADDNAAFVLQIENFTVRNRVAGLGVPTAINQECVTCDQADQMIRTAVSSSAATKQDTLTAANGGTGISVSDAGIISVSDIPQSAVTGLSAALEEKQNTLTAGCRMVIVGGSTVDQARYFAIEPAVMAPANQTTSVTLGAGKAYEIHAVAANAKVLLNREEPVGGTHTFGLEGHAEIFVANTGCIQTGENVVLSQPLEPDAINYCTVRFREGVAVISVEDHIGGYIVISGGTGSGSLPYGLASAGSAYIAFNDTLAARTIDMGGAVTNGEKHVVGNSYSDTILTGGVSCTSKTTFANLAMSGAACLAGTLALGDVFIPAGGTVSVSGGSLAVEKVIGDGGVIELGNTSVELPNGSTVRVQGCTVTGGSATNGGAFNGGADVVFTVVSSVIAGNSASNTGGGIRVSTRGKLFVSGSVVSGNTANLGDIYIYYGSAVIQDSTIGTIYANNAAIALTGVNHIHGGILRNSSDSVITVERGTVIDLTGNTAPTPIAPGLTGSSVIFAPGGATVYPSAGSSSAYMLGGIAVPQLGNTNEVNLKGNTVTASGGTIANATFTSGTLDMADVYIPQNATVSVGAGGVLSVEKVVGNSGTVDLGGTGLVFSTGYLYASNVVFSNGLGSRGTFFLYAGASALFESCSFLGNSATANGGGGAVGEQNGAVVVFSGCTFSGNKAGASNAALMQNNRGAITLDGCVFSSGQTIYIWGDNNAQKRFVLQGSNVIDKIESYGGGAVTLTISSGATVTLTSSIIPGGAVSIPAGAIVTIIGSGGSSGYFSELALTGATITNAGRIYGATVTVPASGGPWEAYTTEGDSTFEADGTERQEVLAGGVSYIGGL